MLQSALAATDHWVACRRGCTRGRRQRYRAPAGRSQGARCPGRRRRRSGPPTSRRAWHARLCGRRAAAPRSRTVVQPSAVLRRSASWTFAPQRAIASPAVLPAGMILGARVLAEFRNDPNRYADPKSRKNHADTSPVTRASGKHRVLARHGRNRRLNDAVAILGPPTGRRRRTGAALRRRDRRAPRGRRHRCGSGRRGGRRPQRGSRCPPTAAKPPGQRPNLGAYVVLPGWHPQRGFEPVSPP